MDKKEKRISRCLCLGVLYAHTSSNNSFEEVFKNFFNKKDNILGYNLNEQQIEYATKLFELTTAYSEKVDTFIESKLVNWEIKRFHQG